ncbi:MAG: coproporphyrinogen III oxidase family protein [Spirochaetales bacterium]|nr:coproporphyrinogen III oxidase family protein [Spirochaetales bacterium]
MAVNCRSLALRPPASLSLYVHVPFCRSKCPYCDFFSVPQPAPELVREVLAQVETQLAYFARLVAPTRVETVYVGGGTPSLLAPDQLDRLLEAIERFQQAGGVLEGGDGSPAAPAEWTVEANPESLNAEHLAVCTARGVTRLSVGIQSLDDGILSTLGRPAGPKESRRALELLRDRWGGEVNVDVMSGTPGQEWRSLYRDLEEIVDYGPGHVSLYSLSLDDPEHPLARDIDPDRQDRLWLRGQRWLEERGYRNYEISNFARPGHESRHNLRYWRLEPYLGCGPSAASTLPGGPDSPALQGQTEVLRLVNPRSLRRFLEGPACCWGLEVEEVSPREFLFETLMMGLRLRQGIDAAGFAARFGRDLPQVVPVVWQRWVERGWCEPDRERYALSFAGRMILDTLLLELQDALADAGLEDTVVRWG